MSIVYHVLLLDGFNFEVSLEVSLTMFLFPNSLYINLYSPTSGSKERNIQKYKHGDIPLLIATAILSRQWLCP